MNLSFNFHLTENPYNVDNSKYEIWGKFSLTIENIKIIDYQWDLLKIFEWFFKNESNLIKDMPFDVGGVSSIAEARDLLYDQITDNTSLDYIEKVEEYFSSHSFKLNGTPLGTFYIGSFKSIAQISLKKRDVFHSYTFKMDDFIIDTKKKIFDFVEYWNSSTLKTDEAVGILKDMEKEYAINFNNI